MGSPSLLYEKSSRQPKETQVDIGNCSLNSVALWSQATGLLSQFLLSLSFLSGMASGERICICYLILDSSFFTSSSSQRNNLDSCFQLPSLAALRHSHLMLQKETKVVKPWAGNSLSFVT